MAKPNQLWPKGHHPSWVKFMKAHMAEYQTVVLSDRLYGDMKAVADLATADDGEVGGFLIKTGVGVTNRSIGVRLVNLVIGNGRSIVLEPQEELEPGEEYIGTFHSHPVTPVPSVHDVLTFLADPNEKCSIVRGVDGTINLKVKTEQTRLLGPEMVEPLKQRYPKGDDGMSALVRDFNFLFYQGKDDTLTRAYSEPGTGTISLDELSLGIHGAEKFPESTKKRPQKKGPDHVAEGASVKSYFWKGQEYVRDESTGKLVPKNA
jgi:hypothetical protein